MKKLHIISAQPSDLVFCWQLRVQLTNFRKFGYLAQYKVIIVDTSEWRNDKSTFSKEWEQLQKDFPEAQFYWYDANKHIKRLIETFGYVSLIRPWVLQKFFADHPELEKDAIFYLDSDVLFTKKLDFTKFLIDDVNYLSDTHTYIGAEYFQKKQTSEHVEDSLKEKFSKMDVLADVLGIIGIPKKVAVDNEKNSGGAQYLLKNINAKFWADVLDACMMIKIHLHGVNQRYFKGASEEEEQRIPNQSKVQWQEWHGFQAWCADMWAVLWLLWKRGAQTKCPLELDFAWATDDVERLKDVYLYHDAGGGKEDNLFDKRQLDYVNNIKTPFEDDLSFVRKDKASYYYVKAIEEAKQLLIIKS